MILLFMFFLLYLYRGSCSLKYIMLWDCLIHAYFFLSVCFIDRQHRIFLIKNLGVGGTRILYRAAGHGTLPCLLTQRTHWYWAYQPMGQKLELTSPAVHGSSMHSLTRVITYLLLGIKS
ncbi:hypothetical protein VPH35_037936 [Triticum aestivum]